MIVVIVLLLGQQEDVLMCLGAAILHTLGHGVRLVPNDVLTQIPSVRLQGKRNPPRDADEILLLQSLLILAVGRNEIGGHTARVAVGYRLRGRGTVLCAHVRVAKVQPQGSIVPQDATNLTEDLDHLLHIAIDGILLTDLRITATVVTQPEVRGRSDTGVDALVG